MERRVRPHRYGARDRAQAQRRLERDAAPARSDRAPEGAQRRVPREHAGRVSRLRGGRDGKMEPRRARGQYQARLARPCPGCGAARSTQTSLRSLRELDCATSAFTRVFDALWRCTADPGPPQTGTIPGLQRTTSTVRSLEAVAAAAAAVPQGDIANPLHSVLTNQDLDGGRWALDPTRGPDCSAPTHRIDPTTTGDSDVSEDAVDLRCPMLGTTGAGSKLRKNF